MSQNLSVSSTLKQCYGQQWMLATCRVVWDVVSEVSHTKEVTVDSTAQTIGRVIKKRKNDFLVPWQVQEFYSCLKGAYNICNSLKDTIDITRLKVAYHVQNYWTRSPLTSSQLESQGYPRSGSNFELLDKVSPEVLVEIFEMLSFEDLIVCQKVCKKWQQVIAHPSFLKKMDAKLCFTGFFLKKITTTSLLIENHLLTVLKSQETYKVILCSSVILGNLVFLQRAFKNASAAVDKWKLVPEETRLQWMQKCNALIRYFRNFGGNHEMHNELINEIGFDVGIFRRFHRDELIIEYSTGTEYSSPEEFNSATISYIQSWPQQLAFFSTIYVIIPSLSEGYRSLSSLIRSYPQRKNAEWLKTLSLPRKLAQDPLLSHDKCHASGRVPLIPVRDRCGHLFDAIVIKYSSVICPTTNLRINIADVAFDFEVSSRVQEQYQKMIKKASLLEFFSKKETLLKNIQKISFVTTPSDL